MPFVSIEQQLIEFIKTEVSNQYIGDDCAVLPGGLLASCDSLVEGVHFLLPQMSLEDLGWKSVAVNLSDIAAMAGIPEFLLVNLSLPKNLSIPSFKLLFRAILDYARVHHVKVVGGDINAGCNLSICITVLGRINPAGSWLRSKARPGDVIIATGDFGASAAGLWAMLSHHHSFKYCLARHKRPEPRIKEALCLASTAAHPGALIDTSDGLADALMQISTSSNVGMEIKENLIPVHQEVPLAAQAASVDLMNWVLYGGEDYELVGCVSPADWDLLKASKTNFFKKIGDVCATPGVFMEKSTGKKQLLDPSLIFQHLQAGKVQI